MSKFPILSLIVWLPIISGVFLLLIGRYVNEFTAKVFAFIVSFIGLLLIIPIWIKFDQEYIGFQFLEFVPWIEIFNINYHLGIDGISVLLLILNNFITFIIVLSAWNFSSSRILGYLSLFLILAGFINGVFCSLDAILFYIFFEATLIPMFLIIGIWGGSNRIYAAIKFFLYTLMGSLLTFVALIYLYMVSGNTFNIIELYNLPLSFTEQILIFLAFLFAFGVKIPMWPVHTWLPDAHVEAPTCGSMVLAAILLKLGAYGLIRFSLPIAPDASLFFAPYIIFLSLIAIVYIGFVAIVQDDMKKLIAYSSIAHMGFVTLGIFLFNELGIEGAILQMVSHGFISAAMFLCVGILYDRMHTKKISEFGGVINKMPYFAAFFLIFSMANSGLPGTSGFVGEFLVILASMKVNFWYAFAAGTTLILGASYSLWMYKRVVFGKISNQKIDKINELETREFIILLLCTFPIILMGIYPILFSEFLHASVKDLLEIFYQ